MSAPPPPGQPGRPPYMQGPPHPGQGGHPVMGPGGARPPYPQQSARPLPPSQPGMPPPAQGGTPIQQRPGGISPMPGQRPPMLGRPSFGPPGGQMRPPFAGQPTGAVPPRTALSPIPPHASPSAPGIDPRAVSPRPNMPPVRPGQPPHLQQPAGSLAQQVNNMNLGGQPAGAPNAGPAQPGMPSAVAPGTHPGAGPTSPPPQPQGADAGPARTKRSARAYHKDDAPPPAPSAWGNVPPPVQGPGAMLPPGQQPQQQPQQPAWQAEAANRAAQLEAMAAAQGISGADEDALDQVPGLRNQVSPQMAAANQARMMAAQAQAQSRRGHLHAQGGGGGSISLPHFGAAGMPGLGGAGMAQPGAAGFPGQQPGLSPAQGAQAPPQPGGIAQPPHQAGQRLPGPRSKIDPDQIPSPVEAMDNDQEFFDREWFATCGRGGLPLSTTDFAAVDQGNCSPKHMRLTTYSVPVSDDMANTSQLPMALIVQPLAQLRADEAVIPVVDCGPGGPPRCKRCRSYINPWAIFVEGGQKWICNLCGTATEVSPDYFCHLDMSGRRADFEVRPELSRGSVEFRVPKEYWAVQAAPPASLMLPVAPAFTTADTAELNQGQENGAAEGYSGTTMGLGGQVGAAAKASTRAAGKAASEALGTFGQPQGKTVVRAPRALTYLFVIDVSFSAVRCGSLKATVEHLREVLYGPKQHAAGEVNGANGDALAANGNSAEEGPGFGLPHGSRVGILTFDRTLHFYNLQPELEQAQMLVVGDIDEPFVPINQGLLADPWGSRHLIEALLENLPGMFAESMVAEAAFGGAVRAAQAAMSTIGGSAHFFLATIPTVGPGALRHREDTSVYGTDKEKTLFLPADTWYRAVAEECVDAGLGLNVWFFPSQYIDVATIGSLCGLTGGDLFFHPRFDPVRDGVRLGAQIRRSVLRETGYNATMRIRCSNGLHITEHHGNFLQRNVTDLEMANIDADKAVGALIKHDAKLDEKQEAHFQAAILYTTADGERRVRCHNIAVPVTSLLGNVFRYADLDSTITYYMKESAALAHQKSLRDVRHYVTERCVKILLAYRRNCAAQTSPGQLILPESFKLLPLYALGIIKTKAIKGGNVTSDVRTYYMRHLRSLGAGPTMSLLYPRMIALHTMSEDDGEPIKIQRPAEDGSGTMTTVQGIRIKSPPLLRPSYIRMEAHGAYLLENGEVCLLWLGAQVNPRLLEDLYGVNALDELDPRMTALPKLPTKLSRQVRALVKGFAAQRGKAALPVLLAREHRDGTEVEFANNLVEDQNNDAMSYVDYLCHIHRIITAEMSGSSGAAARDAAQQAENHSLWRGW